MAADCEAALTAAEPLCSRLEVAYDGLDLTPARVAQRLHMLRMDGVGSISGPSDEEREYAAVFKPVRKYRQELREHISGKGAAAAAAPGDASVMRAATMQLAAHEQSTQLGSAACHVLSEVGARDSEATPGMRAAAFSLVAACMAAHDGHEEIIKYACPAMTALGRGLVATTDAWFPTEGIAVALRALQRYGSSAGIVSAAMYSLYRWTPQAGVAEAIVAAGAIRPCAAALAKHSRDLDVAKSACGLLCGLSDVPGAIATVAAAGGIPPVVEALALHASNRDLAEIACAALRKVVTRMPELTAAVLAADAIPPVVAAMSAHVHDDGVAEPACAVVSQIVQNLCESGAKTDVGVASRAIASSGGIPALVAALAHHHRESETVTVMGCMTLGVLVTDDAAYRGFVKAGGIPAMVSVLKAAGTQPRSPVSAPLLFSRLAEASAGYRRAIHAAGGIPALVGAMSAVLAKPSDTTADFVCFATEALQSMLAEPEHAAAMVSAGVVPAIVTLLHAKHGGKIFSFDLSAASAVSLLGRLSKCGHTEAIVAGGGGPLLAGATAYIEDAADEETSA